MPFVVKPVDVIQGNLVTVVFFLFNFLPKGPAVLSTVSETRGGVARGVFIIGKAPEKTTRNTGFIV